MNQNNQLKFLSSYAFLMAIICAAFEGSLTLAVISAGLFFFALSTKQDNT